jgi:predicted TIM-barrel fold metal-dependent hydrolase
LLLQDWKQSWVEATNSTGELKCQVEAAWGEGFTDGETLIRAMDEAGVESILATDLLAWSYRRQQRFAKDMTEQILELAKTYPGRVYGLADYDPFEITPSLSKLQKNVETGFYKGVYVHVYGYDIGLDHRKFYPLYAKCEELDLPVSMQVGHVLEAMPSEHGRPIQLDRIACDFPNLKIIGTHTGWPWVDEMLSVAIKWPNVYINVSAWLPKYFSPSLVQFMKSKTGASKVIFGTNGLSWSRYIEQMQHLDLSEATLRAVLRDNARAVFRI